MARGIAVDSRHSWGQGQTLIASSPALSTQQLQDLPFALLCLPSILCLVTMIRFLARSILPEQRWPLDARRQT